jgi:fatty acid desaturase
MERPTDADATARSRRYLEFVAPYQHPDAGRSLLQFAGTLVCLIALWFAMYRSLVLPHAVTLLLAIPAAGFLVRLFIVQHDCGHGSFFTECHESTPELQEVPTLAFREGLTGLRLKLWDEDSEKLISFREATRATFAN